MPITFRSESDSVGTKQIPKDAYYGVHSLRAVENFSISGTRLHPEMINNLARLKKSLRYYKCQCRSE